MTNSLRTFAALLVVLTIGLSLSGAQEDPSDDSGLSVREDGKGLELKGAVDQLTLNEAIQLYVEESGKTVLYDPKRLSGNVRIIAPSSGTEMTSEALAQSALKQFRLLMASDGNVMEIIPAAEGITQCPTVTREELENLPPGQFAKMVIQLRASEANAVRGALQNLTTRQGGVVNPIAGANALIIADYVYNLKDLIVMIDRMEAGTEVVSRVFTLKNVVYSDIHGALAACLDSNQARRPGAPAPTAIGATSNGKYLVVTGVVWEVERIEEVIQQLDVAQGE